MTASYNSSSLALGDLASIVVRDRACICSVYVQVEDASQHMLTMVPAKRARILAVGNGGVVECS